MLLVSTAMVLSVGCEQGPDAERLVVVDGSSSVYPITEAMAEDFQRERSEYRVVVGVSGTGGGFQRFCAGETDVSGASRTMTRVEQERCRAAGVVPIRFPLALDGVTVVAHPGNPVARCLTLTELRQIWEPSSAVKTWRDVRPGFPAEELHLYGPGTDSGTFDFFTTVVVGRPQASRADYYQSEDDFLIARGVSGDRWALGYFSRSYFVGHRDRLRAVELDMGFGCTAPTREAIADGRYSPLTRELFVYVNRGALGRKAVREFIASVLEDAPRTADEVGYVALPEREYQRGMQLFERLTARVGV